MDYTHAGIVYDPVFTRRPIWHACVPLDGATYRALCGVRLRATTIEERPSGARVMPKETQRITCRRCLRQLCVSARKEQMMAEPSITINLHVLTSAQAMTLRVALTNFLTWLSEEGLGADEQGQALARAYQERGREILAMMGLRS